MSELKVIDLGNIRESIEKDEPVYYEYYAKSEADKVIAEKDEEIEELKEQFQEERSAKVNYKISARDLGDGLREAVSEIHHHRYKRCVAMARACANGRDYSDSICYRRAIRFYARWEKIWLELAEKFKEAK